MGIICELCQNSIGEDSPWSFIKGQRQHILKSDCTSLGSFGVMDSTKKKKNSRIRAIVKCTLVAGHFLRPPYEGKCSRPHGHNWAIEAVFETDKPDARGFAGIDFDDFKNALMKYDHQMLNDIPPFDKIQPSAENIASYLGGIFPDCIRVKVAETESGYAIWTNE